MSVKNQQEQMLGGRTVDDSQRQCLQEVLGSGTLLATRFVMRRSSSHRSSIDLGLIILRMNRSVFLLQAEKPIN